MTEHDKISTLQTVSQKKQVYEKAWKEITASARTEYCTSHKDQRMAEEAMLIIEQDVLN